MTPSSPEGCSGTAPLLAVTIEAGAQWMPTYNAVTTKAASTSRVVGAQLSVSPD
jgi:hypothetical protein